MSEGRVVISSGCVEDLWIAEFARLGGWMNFWVFDVVFVWRGGRVYGRIVFKSSKSWGFAGVIIKAD